MFVLTPRAEQDIGDIWDYIAGDSIDAADRVLDALDKALHRLAKNPGIGHFRLADGRHRFWLVYSDLIVYRFEPSPCSDSRFARGSRCAKYLGACDFGTVTAAGWWIVLSLIVYLSCLKVKRKTVRSGCILSGAVHGR